VFLPLTTPDPKLVEESTRLERDNPLQKIDAAQFEPLFESRLEMYASDKAALQAEDAEQSATSARLRAASAAFSAARASGDDETGRARRAALQRLARAHTAYREVASHLDAGRRFYNDLARMATAFRDRCREFALRRRDEAARLERYVSLLSPRGDD
jgi:programmed cell death 6-interacting protein